MPSVLQREMLKRVSQRVLEAGLCLNADNEPGWMDALRAAVCQAQSMLELAEMRRHVRAAARALDETDGGCGWQDALRAAMSQTERMVALAEQRWQQEFLPGAPTGGLLFEGNTQGERR